MGLVLGLFSPGKAWAASPEFARTEEEWTKLEDNTIEYGELEDLVHEYNATVQDNYYTYIKFREDYGDTNDDVSQAYYDLAQDFYDDMSGDDDASSMMSDLNLQIQADNMMEQADESLEDMRLEADTARKMLELYEKEYDLALAGVQAGTATEADVLEAQDYVLTAQSSLASAQSAMESVYDSLCLMVGRDTDGSLTIASIPEADESRISAMNLETDTQKAIGNNTTLINERHTSAESSTAGSENKKRSVAESEEKRETWGSETRRDEICIRGWRSQRENLPGKSSKSMPENSRRLWQRIDGVWYCLDEESGAWIPKAFPHL